MSSECELSLNEEITYTEKVRSGKITTQETTLVAEFVCDVKDCPLRSRARPYRPFHSVLRGNSISDISRLKGSISGIYGNKKAACNDTRQ